MDKWIVYKECVQECTCVHKDVKIKVKYREKAVLSAIWYYQRPFISLCLGVTSDYIGDSNSLIRWKTSALIPCIITWLKI